ncbi:MAG: protein phosphatase 2C domain-containing protein [Peptococcaceae bacterium]|nr:protein phosphatase 2C domain-containing protein [Peptococcaceae bacterium]
MDYTIWARTDIGIKKTINQDSLSVRVFDTVQGKMAFAVLCDGMGGLDRGELASATVVKAFMNWADSELPLLCYYPLGENIIRDQWKDLVYNQNAKIMKYGQRQGINLGTTIVAILLTQTNYYIINVGDSRIYEIADKIMQITRDQTVVAREVSLGKMTPEQAKRHPKRNVLLQCVGASEVLRPEICFGEIKKDAVYMLCSDGFRHEVTPQELFTYLNPKYLTNSRVMKKHTDYLIELNKKRRETDNISVVLIRSS